MAEHAVPTPSPFASLMEMLGTAYRCYLEHREEIEAFGAWGRVMRACKATKLYAPMGQTWREIADADAKDRGTAEIQALILGGYGPGGADHDLLRDEILAAPLLQNRVREAGQVLDAVARGSDYLAICGALPLVESILADAHGSWKQPPKYPITERLHRHGALTPEEETELIFNHSALVMLRAALRDIWGSQRPPAGAITAALNRNLALHGTARGWDTRENAVRATLLVAAAARVAEPLLAPRAP